MTTNNFDQVAGIYLRDDWRRSTILGLLWSAHRLFLESERVSRAGEFRKLLGTIGKGMDEWPQEIHDLLAQFSDGSLVDAILITAACENALKARLLDCGYMVHDVEEWDEAKKRARVVREPTEIGFAETRKVLDEKTKGWTLKNVRNTTIGIGRILTDKRYLKAAGIGGDLTAAILSYAHRRNNLHFMSFGSSVFQSSDIPELEIICSFINDSTIDRSNELVKQIGLSRPPLQKVTF